MDSVKTKIKINIKSLAAEAKINREICNKIKDPKVKAEISNHRRTTLRKEARLAQLALCYLNGKPRSYCEPVRRNDPWGFDKDLFKKITRFLHSWYNITWFRGNKQIDVEKIKKWLST
jgi:hypothetical protein